MDTLELLGIGAAVILGGLLIFREPTTNEPGITHATGSLNTASNSPPPNGVVRYDDPNGNGTFVWDGAHNTYVFYGKNEPGYGLMTQNLSSPSSLAGSGSKPVEQQHIVDNMNASSPGLGDWWASVNGWSTPNNTGIKVGG